MSEEALGRWIGIAVFWIAFFGVPVAIGWIVGALPYWWLRWKTRAKAKR